MVYKQYLIYVLRPISSSSPLLLPGSRIPIKHFITRLLYINIYFFLFHIVIPCQRHCDELHHILHVISVKSTHFSQKKYLCAIFFLHARITACDSSAIIDVRDISQSILTIIFILYVS